ncbi:MAG: hypothetical protein ABIJ97_04880 [Bacteroidota bacterium]
MKFSQNTILIISNEAWGDIWYSKHNWAFELSKSNTVFFINPPTNWVFKNLFSIKINTKKYTDNLWILYYNNRLPYTRYGLIYRLNEKIVSSALKKWFFKNNINNYIFWTFDPYRFSNPLLLNPIKSIYFIADLYRIKREKRLLKNVDHVFFVSQILADEIKIKNPLILSHGISESEFVVEKLIEKYRNSILYIGGIDFRLDYILIRKLLEAFPNEIFLFIGHINFSENTDFKTIFIEKRFPNLVYHQPVHFKELKNYIAVAKCCLAPMILEVQGNHINHHKLLQYLALGKPVLSAKFIDYSEKRLLLIYETHEDAIKLLTQLINKGEDSISAIQRIEFSKQFLYNSLIKKIETFIE